jgi:murein DD-endopeptidase MepM/ murein hydrolase activator NlpD
MNDRNTDERQCNPLETAYGAGKQAAKEAARKAAGAAAKAATKGVLKAAAYIAGLLGWPVLFILLAVLSAALFVGAFYSAMPSQGALSGVEPSEQDAIIRQYAVDTVREWNVKNTWLAAGEGSFFPGEGKELLGRLADRFGREARLCNQWGDLYAPVLYQAAMSDKDLLKDKNWVKRQIRDAAENLQPFFYYKESNIEVEYRVKDEEGNEKIEIQEYPVYLLVEAYTIRGHWRYSYEQASIAESDGTVRREEKCIRSERVSDGTGYLRKYLEKRYELPQDEDEVLLATQATFEMAQAFTDRRENLAWLEGYGASASFVSAAGIPEEFRAYLAEAERLTGIPMWFLAGLIHRESGWDPNCVNEKSGCFGLTQQHPKYWPERARRWGFDPERDKWDPRAQILAGAYLLKEYGGSVDWAGLDPAGEPPPELRSALARYGGYGSNVGKARGYIDSLWALARGYACSGTWPTPGYTTITSQFGMRKHPVTGVWKEHTGIDIGAPMGAEVVSVSGGVVHAAESQSGWGNVIYVRDNQYEYQYAHLSRIDVKPGDVVEPGAHIGLVGSTGTSTGAHLHFGLRPIGSNSWIDPLPLLNNAKQS